jgi:hypothetical protein
LGEKVLGMNKFPSSQTTKMLTSSLDTQPPSLETTKVYLVDCFGVAYRTWAIKTTQPFFGHPEHIAHILGKDGIQGYRTAPLWFDPFLPPLRYG